MYMYIYLGLPCLATKFLVTNFDHPFKHLSCYSLTLQLNYNIKRIVGMLDFVGVVIQMRAYITVTGGD